MFELNRVVRPSIQKLKPYSSARDEYSGSASVFLDANENPFGELNRYPDPYQNELKELLAKEKGVQKEQIFIGNGSDEVIDLAFRIFCEPAIDQALTFAPTYGMYQVSAEINNVDLITDPLNENFEIDLEALKERIKNPLIKLIFVCSPNNPTGNLIDLNIIESILQDFKGVLVVDEAYIDFSSGDSAIQLIDQYPNLIVSQTFSKAWGLAAARVGVAYASDAIIKLYNKVKPPYNVSLLNQQAAIKSLRNKEEFDRRRRVILEEKARLNKVLQTLDLVEKVYPSEANFFLVKVKDANQTYEELVNRKIIVRNRNKVIANCIRITIGSKEENDKLMDALKSIG